MALKTSLLEKESLSNTFVYQLCHGLFTLDLPVFFNFHPAHTMALTVWSRNLKKYICPLLQLCHHPELKIRLVPQRVLPTLSFVAALPIQMWLMAIARTNLVQYTDNQPDYHVTKEGGWELMKFCNLCFCIALFLFSHARPDLHSDQSGYPLCV